MSDAIAPEKDSYQLEIDRLTQVYEKDGEGVFRTAVRTSWGSPQAYGCLFAVISRCRNNWAYGCLTQIKRDVMYGPTGVKIGAETRTGNSVHELSELRALVAKVRADDRIPPLWPDITHPSQLEPFAEYQRMLDQMWGRSAPPYKLPAARQTAEVI